MGIQLPSFIEIWIVKWVIFPIVTVIILLVMWDYYKEVWRCKNICTEKGFLKYEYISANRVGIGAKCVCTEKIEESGQIDKDAKLVIDLN